MALSTCAMLILAHADTPHSAINSAAPYGYVLYIILSALRLEFRPCLFAGALAALGYGALMLAYWPHLEGAWTGSLSLLGLTLLLRVILLFLGGLAAAFATILLSEPVHTAAGLDGTGLDGAEKIAPIPIRGRREPVQLYRRGRHAWRVSPLGKRRASALLRALSLTMDPLFAVVLAMSSEG
jgi:hypothetical protein